jgi:hypothetical protein
MAAKITKRDVKLIRQWLNCAVASVDTDGDVWIEGPMTGHWLSKERLSEYIKWRTAKAAAKRGRGRPPLSPSGESGH